MAPLNIPIYYDLILKTFPFVLFGIGFGAVITIWISLAFRLAWRPLSIRLERCGITPCLRRIGAFFSACFQACCSRPLARMWKYLRVRCRALGKVIVFAWLKWKRPERALKVQEKVRLMQERRRGEAIA
ncbi:hypothetical protein MMC25_002188 [Agyrium rufum]|nr:hypothetical protein [Agyrium rufum]